MNNHNYLNTYFTIFLGQEREMQSQPENLQRVQVQACVVQHRPPRQVSGDQDWNHILQGISQYF